MRTTRVILATAHLDNDPENNRLRNLRSLCQRCHMIHDRNYHLAQRWITYRLRYVMGASRPAVIDLVALDPNNPRTVAFQLSVIESHLTRLPLASPDGLLGPAERLVGRLAATFRTAEARSVDPAMIAQAEASLMQLSNEIALRYFTHRGGGGDSDGFDA